MKPHVPRPQFPGSAGRTILRRISVLTVLFGIVLFIPLGVQLFRLQILEHEELSRRAVDNQTRRSSVTAARGTIYDRNMTVLAISADVENVCIDPTELSLSGQDTGAIARKLSELLDVDQEKIRGLMADTSYRYQIVKRKVEQQEAAAVRQFITGENITGVYLEPDTRRYYPENTLAAQVLGFVGSDNTGLGGLEAAYDETLTGHGGKIVSAKGNYGTEMLYHHETYYDPQDGSSLVLTIDATVQQMLEKHMREAIAHYDVQNGAFGLVMDAQNGDILAMATLGSFDPNQYAEIYDLDTRSALEHQYMAAMAATGKTREELLEAYNGAVASARLAQWRNRVISDGYEPGSTFKTITLAAALEEGAVTLDSGFFCSGSTTIQGRSKPLHCWKTAGHGQQTTAEALQNSCNVAFARIGIALGGDKLYDYVQRFGLMEPTGIELSGEASGIFFDRATLANPDSYASLASAAFGQTFKITPLQLVRAVAAVVNGGYLLEPHIVREVLDSDGNLLETHGRRVIRRVISEETSAAMRTLLESVVSLGTAKNAQIAGYRIGGKTGTSEKIDVLDDSGNPVEDKIVSFIGIAPVDNPGCVVLVALDTPSRETGYYISGGQMGAPTVREVLADILPYLGYQPDYSGEEAEKADVTVPELVGMQEAKASALLAEAGLSYRSQGDGETVTDQTPAAGAVIPGGSRMILYFGDDRMEEPVEVPNVLGFSPQAASDALSGAGLYMKMIGASGGAAAIAAVSQDPEPGSSLPPGTVVRVEFSDLSARD